MHLVNCDIDYDKDKIREKRSVKINLPRVDFLTGNVAASLYNVDGEAQVLDIAAEGDLLSITVPRLGATASIIIQQKNLK